MSTTDEPSYGQEVTVPMAIGPVRATVREIYGRADNRQVIVLLIPELNPDIIFERTTYSLPLSEVTWEPVTG